MKKVLKTLAVLVVLAAAGFFGYRYYQSQRVMAATSTDGVAYTEYTVSTGSLSKTVTGTGTLSISQTDDVALDYAVTVTDTLVEAGDTVTAGQPLLNIDAVALQTTIETLETELETTETEIATLAEDYSSTTYLKMPQYSRVKEVYLTEGAYIQDVMEQYGAIVLLSLDGWMYVEFPAQETWEIDDTVTVKVGNVVLDGTVRALENGMATITFSDAYSEEGGEVEIVYKGETLGTATAHIHMPYELTTSEKGYIHSVFIEENDRKWEGNRICYLINVPISDSYQALLETRAQQTAQINEMKALRDAGAITAPQDGIVASIVTPSATEQAIDTVLVSLYVGDEKEMIVSVDELDITSVEVGQNVDLAMDAITDHTYAGTVSKISQIGTATSGVTVYDVTLTVEGDDQLKLGMNGTATILVEERENVLLVPITALNTSRGESYVWLKSDSAADGEPGVRTTVETGLSDENYAEVLSGLSEGDVVLITREASTSTTDSRENGMGGMMMDMGGGMPGGSFDGGAPAGSPPSGGGAGGGRTRGN